MRIYKGDDYSTVSTKMLLQTQYNQSRQAKTATKPHKTVLIPSEPVRTPTKSKTAPTTGSKVLGAKRKAVSITQEDEDKEEVQDTVTAPRTKIPKIATGKI
jgi:hypothetical protein